VPREAARATAAVSEASPVGPGAGADGRGPRRWL